MSPQIGTIQSTEPVRNPLPSAGTQVPKDYQTSRTLSELLTSSVRNFIQYPIVIVPGVTFDHYDTLKTIHAYLNSTFLSGSLDENGDERYFHNIITPRNAHATKNIDLDTKDILFSVDNPEGWWFSFLLRNRLQSWMREAGFAQLLNDLATNLPNFGKVIWKKCGEGNELTVKEVDLRDCVFDPSAPTIRDSGLFLERSIMEPWKIMDKVKTGGWNKEAALCIIRGTSTKRDKFIANGGSPATPTSQYSLTDALPIADVWECWGWFPCEAIDAYYEGDSEDLKSRVKKDAEDTADNAEDEDVEYVYAKIIVGNLDSGSPEILYLDEEVDEEDFPYKEINFFRRVPGRCLPLSNSEVLITLQVRMNELVSRFYKAVRMGSLHLFQTKQGIAYKNLMQDAQDGDVIVSKYPIDPIATEIRAFQQYATEYNNIQNQADLLCNTYDIVTGDNLPTNTPFRLGSQMAQNANKIFDQVREDCGIAITEVFQDWILPELMDDLSLATTMDVIGSTDELKMFDEAYRKYLSMQSLKDYILKNNRLPTEDEMDVLDKALAVQLKDKSRKVTIPDKYFTMDKIKSLRAYFDVTDERKNFTAQRDSLSTLLQTIAANPMILENEDSRRLIGYIMESLGMSPMALPSFTSKPVPKNPMGGMMPPGAQGGAGDQQGAQATQDVAAAQAA